MKNFINFKSTIHIVFILFLSIFSSSCLPFIVGGSVSTAVISSSGERSPKEIKDDIIIFTSIKNQYIQYNSNDLFQHVNVRVMDGVVLLTGNVKYPKTKMLAEKIAWIPNGVKDVINEIHINDYSKLKDYTLDKIISAHIKTRLILEKNISISNYKYHVLNGTVYVLGVTKSSTEMEAVLNLISQVYGVKKVINYVLIKKT
jgi:hyperosmotically inducible protein